MVNNIDIGRIDMGERKCAFDGCNALEFRATGYCLRHGEKGLNTKKIRVVEVPKDGEREEIKAEWILFLIGIPISFFGIGESINDMIPFNMENYLNSIIKE